jgi:Pyrimidine dimer DNA glycosylase
MNIFYLSNDTEECAKAHCDKHCVKMILEYGQLLSTAHHLLNDVKSPLLYAKTHENHPCAVWVRESVNNYVWLTALLFELCKEYTHRYNKVHRLEKMGLLSYLCDNLVGDTAKLFTIPPQCMPDGFKHQCTIKAYENYYIVAKREFLIYTNRKPPAFLGGFLHLSYGYNKIKIVTR